MRLTIRYLANFIVKTWQFPMCHKFRTQGYSRHDEICCFSSRSCDGSQMQSILSYYFNSWYAFLDKTKIRLESNNQVSTMGPITSGGWLYTFKSFHVSRYVSFLTMMWHSLGIVEMDPIHTVLIYPSIKTIRNNDGAKFTRGFCWRSMVNHMYGW